MLRPSRFGVCLLALLLIAACDNDEATPDGGHAPDRDASNDEQVPDASEPDSGAECDGAGKPEMTGPIGGLQASYAAGDEMEISVPVDEDTERVIVGVYEAGSLLYLGGTAEDVSGPDTQQLSLYAGVVNGETGTFYIAVELCSTSICTTPFVRNTYQRADRESPFEDGETYEATRENVSDVDLIEVCPTSIPIQTFEIE